MEIIKTQPVKFKDLKPSQCFTLNGNIYMKLNNPNENCLINAVNIGEALGEYIMEETKVDIVATKLIWC